MRIQSLPQTLIHMTLTSIVLLDFGSIAKAQDLPSYMKPISGRTVSTPADTATKNILALNTGMFELYDNASKIFERNILSKHPVILGLFSGAGGRFILHRPGMAPLEAPSVPLVYQLLKSVDHSTMALAQVVGPYLDNPTDQSWRGPMLAYRARMQSALDGLDEIPMPPEWRDNDRIVLQNNNAFMDDCLAKRAVSFAALEAFTKKQAPYLKLDIAWAAETQVTHWMKVLADWKKMLGDDWEKTYAASNTIYGTRQNNVLFSQHAVSTAATLFLRLDLRRGAAGRPFVCDDLLQALDAIVGESRDSIFTDPVDAQAAIVAEHVHLEFPQPFLILAEHLGDVVDGKDV